MLYVHHFSGFFFSFSNMLQSLIPNHMQQDHSKPASERRIALFLNDSTNMYCQTTEYVPNNYFFWTSTCMIYIQAN